MLKSYFVASQESQDGQYIMVHSPRVLDFELFIVQHALKLLTNIGQKDLLHRASLE